MGRVDKDAMHAALERLADEGLIQMWEKRPLGMYMIGLVAGEMLPPDTKETALWVQGASYVSSVNDMRQLLDRESGRSDAEKLLTTLVEARAVAGWQKDDDGDFEIVGRDGEALGIYAKEAPSWLSGFCWALGQAFAVTETQRSSLAKSLEALRGMGRLSAWFVDDDNQYRSWIVGREDPIHLPDDRAVSHFLQGFGAGQ